MYPGYSLDQLIAFLTVVDEGSFTAAGRRLGRVQSAVSYAVAQLEEGLGTELFDRSGRTPALTPAGARLAAEARLVVSQARELAEVAAALRSGVEAELRVVIDALYPRERLVSVCVGFRERFPATALRLEIALLGDVVARVQGGGADLGVSNLAGGGAGDLSHAYLGAVVLVPVCAAHHALAAVPGPQRVADLRQHTQVVHSERDRSDTTDQGVLGSRTWRVTDLAVKVDLIRAGVGWGSLPVPLAEPLLRAGELVRLHPEPWPAQGHRLGLHALTRPEEPLGRAGQWFREQLVLEGS